jgi:hypothetical protein
MNIPFSERIDELPVWRLQVDDPDHAVEAKVELAYHPLLFPQGGVLGLCLKVYDRSARPTLFHHAVAFGSLELRTLRQHPAMLLIFERKGWNSDKRKTLSVNLASLADLPEGQDALAPYLEAYRKLQSSGGPEQTWAAIERGLKGSVKAGSGGSKLLWVFLALAAAAAGIYLKFGSQIEAFIAGLK